MPATAAGAEGGGGVCILRNLRALHATEKRQHRSPAMPHPRGSCSVRVYVNSARATPLMWGCGGYGDGGEAHTATRGIRGCRGWGKGKGNVVVDGKTRRVVGLAIGAGGDASWAGRDRYDTDLGPLQRLARGITNIDNVETRASMSMRFGAEIYELSEMLIENGFLGEVKLRRPLIWCTCTLLCALIFALCELWLCPNNDLVMLNWSEQEIGKLTTANGELTVALIASNDTLIVANDALIAANDALIAANDALTAAKDALIASSDRPVVLTGKPTVSDDELTVSADAMTVPNELME
ncbi:hypothetical protein B0H16DRAFT_1480948 [Mycena metata]|uniref:Uncharacterized protein n=1 Tax=Mycena metata TaxID=1033252 RepID=A0AAD7H0W7_9AGAR|nr:hypothetical protein B0H16DRAFT_1480948 [Mycena metata]